MDLTLVVLAAGLSTRFGRLKQLEPVGPSGETLLDYGIYDAIRAGFSRAVLVIRRELTQDFRDRIGRFFGDSIAVSYTAQELAALPPGYTVPEGRAKPWGTGHAVLAAETDVDGPFVVMNADDFYGAAAFRALAEHLRTVGDLEVPEFAAAGYRLSDTLSPSGGVSRAVCELDGDGYLVAVREVKDIRDEGGTIAGATLAGERLELAADETISMNLWAATPAGFPVLRAAFSRFLEKRGDDRDAEFLLSMAVNEAIARGEMRVKVFPTPGPWLGVTYPEDRQHVAEKLDELIRAGHYPRDLSLLFP